MMPVYLKPSISETALMLSGSDCSSTLAVRTVNRLANELRWRLLIEGAKLPTEPDEQRVFITTHHLQEGKIAVDHTSEILDWALPRATPNFVRAPSEVFLGSRFKSVFFP